MKLIELKDKLVPGMILRSVNTPGFTIKIISTNPWEICTKNKTDLLHHPNEHMKICDYGDDYEIIYKPSEENMPVTLETRINNIRNELRLLENELKEYKKPKLIPGKFYQFVTINYKHVCVFVAMDDSNIRTKILRGACSHEYVMNFNFGEIKEIYEISPEETIQNLYSGNVTRISENLIEAIRE
jgi:hypothetical protein